ncbi:hypothetical protein VA596_37500 [Amycolatopsis sp., V23-08]|uniref:Uncharacterized protein n=1 Tax=Amycolatopsis heterodermiae TaxID=3110235 RepID=A0ABU5RI67_9PSEU|nr:hypothetical protein [Amycolatopsis sp., V23-08]MEA5365275.1 hypothetical protein [Amycolatopsis sp., V23-08]
MVDAAMKRESAFGEPDDLGRRVEPRRLPRHARERVCVAQGARPVRDERPHALDAGQRLGAPLPQLEQGRTGHQQADPSVVPGALGRLAGAVGQGLRSPVPLEPGQGAGEAVGRESSSVATESAAACTAARSWQEAGDRPGEPSGPVGETGAPGELQHREAGRILLGRAGVPAGRCGGRHLSRRTGRRRRSEGSQLA